MIKLTKFTQLVQLVILRCTSTRKNGANNFVPVITLMTHLLMIKEGKYEEVTNVIKYAPTSLTGFPGRLIIISLTPTTAKTLVFMLTYLTDNVRLVKMINISLLVKLMASSAAYILIFFVMVTLGVTMVRMRNSFSLVALIG